MDFKNQTKSKETLKELEWKSATVHAIQRDVI